MNLVVLQGRLGKDPIIRRTNKSDKYPNGAPVANLSLATNETWVTNGKREEKTEWHKVVAFNGIAKVCEDFLAKGKEITVQGRLQTNKWTDNKGIDRYTTASNGSDETRPDRHLHPSEEV